MTVALSFTGSVLGMQQMEVKPPAAAARAPVSMVSACSMPGSRRCTCMSMKPGATTRPVGIEYFGARGVEIRADGRRCGRLRSARRLIASKPRGRIDHAAVLNQIVWHQPACTPFEHRHAHGDAVLHLIQNHRALRIGDFGRQLAARD